MPDHRDDAAEEYRLRQKVVGRNGWDFSHLYPKEQETPRTEDEERKFRDSLVARSVGTIADGITQEIDTKQLKTKVDGFVRDHADTLREFAERLMEQKTNLSWVDSENRSAWQRSPMTDRNAFNQKLDKFKAFLNAAVIELGTIGDTENQNAAGTALVEAWDHNKKWDQLDRMLRLAGVENRHQNDDLYVLGNQGLSEKIAAAYEAFHAIVEWRKEHKQGSGMASAPELR